MPSEQAPPTIPTDLTEIADAGALCAKVYRKGTLSLNQYERERLVRYCGRIPESKKQAQKWRIYLRALRKEAEAEPEEEV